MTGDPLADRLSALGDGPVPPLTPAAEVRARGARRRTRARAAVGGGVAAVLLLAGGGAYAALSGPSSSDRLDVARDDPAPAASTPVPASATSVPRPSASAPSPTSLPRSAFPGAAVCPAGSGCTSPLPTPPPPVPDVSGAVLGLRDVRVAEPGDWEVTGTADEGPLLDPCPGGTRYPRDRDRTADASQELTSTREAGGTTVLQQVARYPSDDVARDAAAGYVRAVRGCPTSTDEAVTVTYEVVSTTTDSSLATTYVRRAVTTAEVPGATEYYAVQQLGDVVSVLVVGHGEDGDPGVGVVQPFARRVAQRLQRAVTG